MLVEASDLDGPLNTLKSDRLSKNQKNSSDVKVIPVLKKGKITEETLLHRYSSNIS